MKPAAYYECLRQTAERDGLDPSDLQAVAVMDILNMERALGFNLSEAYEEFLYAVGVGPVYGGLAEWLHLDITLPRNVLEVSRDLAAQMAPATRAAYDRNTFPRDFLAIYDGCDGDLFGLRPAATGGEYRPQIYAWNTEDLELREVAPDFESFLDYLTDCDEQ